MPRCPSCREYLRGTRDRIGARCPHCRDPLYERPVAPERVDEGIDPLESRCAIHPHNLSRGTCRRCGNFLCGVCRTRWQTRSLCLACVEYLLEAREQQSEVGLAHSRQAMTGLVCGGVAWLLTALAIILFVMAGLSEEPNPALVGLGVLPLLGSPLFSLLGVGWGAAAIRIRGDHMITATAGLVLSGLHVGVVVGLFSFAMWTS